MWDSIRKLGVWGFLTRQWGVETAWHKWVESRGGHQEGGGVCIKLGMLCILRSFIQLPLPKCT